jgi:hypothetical protein
MTLLDFDGASFLPVLLQPRLEEPFQSRARSPDDGERPVAEVVLLEIIATTLLVAQESLCRLMRPQQLQVQSRVDSHQAVTSPLVGPWRDFASPVGLGSTVDLHWVHVSLPSSAHTLVLVGEALEQVGLEVGRARVLPG